MKNKVHRQKLINPTIPFFLVGKGQNSVTKQSLCQSQSDVFQLTRGGLVLRKTIHTQSLNI